MINNNNNNIHTNLNLNSKYQISSFHFQPFRVSESIINFKEKFLQSIQSKNIINAYQRLNLLKDKNKFLSTTKTTENYHLFERNLIKKFLYSNKNELLKKNLLKQMWKSSQFCDLLLIVQGSEYLAHRFVLAENSEKFKQIFNQRKNDFVTRIHLHYSTHKALQLILNYLYTDNLILTIRNIDDILICTKELDIKKIIDLCILYLSNIDKRNVFQIMDIACKHNLEEIYQLAHRFLNDSIDECIQTKEFIDINYCMLGQILLDENIKKRNEFYVLDRTLQWLSCNHISNKEKIFELLEKIRWKNLNYLLLKEIIATNYEVLHNSNVKQWLIKKLKDIYNNQQRNEYLETEFLSTTSSGFHLAINQSNSFLPSKTLIIGGGFHLDETMTLNQNAGGSISHPFEKEQVVSTNWVYSIDRSNKWESIPTMLEQRVYFGCTVLNNKIWVAGGLGIDGKLIRSVEYYDPEINIWKLVKRLRSPRLGCAMTSFRNKLFIIGGYCNLKSKSTLDNVTVFDANNKIWLKKQPLPTARCHGQIITHSNSFFYIGGCIELEKNETSINDRIMSSLNLLDKYDVHQDTWITEVHMKQARHDLCAEMIDDRIFIINGVNSKRNLILKSMESYNINTDVWTTLSTYSNDYIIGAASCVITI